ncbi:MFS transporter [Paenibacillus montaniterrae]|uniref:MFS transporter n=1 Tax=Paenibacillus montaniterrae TaxID=429341 RepID=A0A920CX76_9BACL|nr:MFS transporter [Paenibacillus montaniterrae]GIP16626.1 MFS transporter [Paenibacillus montaniterrae]
MKKTWLLGFGFFSISLVWALYNAFVPLFLKKYLDSAAIIGFMMTLDNYFGLFLQPFIGRKSDKTDTKFGKRMPYLIVGMPLAALFGALIPLHTSYSLLITFMVLMNLSMSLYRSPTVALMPDITPPHKRTQANGIINLMGGLGSILAFTVGSKLYDQHIALPFFTSSALTLISLCILMLFIRERRDALEYVPAAKATIDKQPGIEQQPTRVWGRPHTLLAAAKRELKPYTLEWTLPTILLLGAIYFWFFSYQGIEALFTLYATEELSLSDSQASMSLAFFSVAFVAAAIPAGYLGAKLGKKQVICFGIIGLMILFVIISFVNDMTTLRTLLLLGGVCWALININSYPYVISLGKQSSIGTRTGIYYIASSLAALSSPPLMGLFMDKLGYSSLFFVAAGGMLLALGFIIFVKDHNS